MSANFKCPTCGKEHYISQYISKGDGKTYDKYKKLLTCDCEAKSELESTKQWDGGMPTLGSSYQKQTQILKDRSKQHFNKEIKERQVELNKRKDLNTD